MKIFFLFASFLLAPSYALCINFLAVPEQNQSGLASISHQLSNQNGYSGNTFLSSEKISLSFDLSIAESDTGFKGGLYLLALYKSKIYMNIEQGGWQIWDGDPAKLQALEYKALSSRESISVLSNNNLSAGEYLVMAGYQGRDDTIKFNQTVVSFIVFDENKNQLHRIEQPEFLKSYLNQGLISSKSRNNIYVVDAVFSGPVAEMDSSASADGSPVSQTNLQESGVDESDRIKTDGSTLFVLETCKDSSAACLNTYQMTESPASVKPLGQLKVADNAYQQGEIYLYHPPGKNQRTIIWLNNSFSGSVWANWDTPYYWQNNTTDLLFINATAAEQLEPFTQISIDGALISSRLIGDTLYLISRNSPTDDTITPYLMPASKITDDGPAEQQQSLKTLLPEISINDEPSKPLVKATECYVTAQNSMRYYDASIINITAIPVNEPHNFKSTCIAGPVETVYVSTQAIYLASNRYPYEMNANAIVYSEDISYQTEIHKFSFKASLLSYQASGRVPGHLGWDADKRSFRMGEYNGILKVATSLGDTWNNTSRTRVAVLEEASDSQLLNEISHIDNLGKPGERLYATRFIGQRGFLVTFKVTDPLYVLDFSNPQEPAVIGELEISGYSDYLHPVSENLLLGIGKDAIPDAIPDANTDRGAWYQGVKVSLFDISNASSLKEIDSIVLGKRGSSSTALYNHHAVSWLDNPDTLSSTLAIPVSLHNTPNRYDYYSSSGDPREYFDWTHTGLYVFNIDKKNPSLSLDGKLIADSNEGELNSDPSYAPFIANDRSVIQGGSVHYIHNNEILSSAIDELK